MYVDRYGNLVKEILVKAKAKIENPANWIQGEFARTHGNMPVHATHPEACKFCSVGAIRAVTDEVTGDNTHPLDKQWARAQAVSEIGNAAGEMPTNFNDSHTHAEVLQVFDKAIAKLS